MTYKPRYPGDKTTQEWLHAELQRIAQEMMKAHILTFDKLSDEPERPREGMVACADGTNWHPKSGSFSSTASSSGLFLYINGAWSKL